MKYIAWFLVALVSRLMRRHRIAIITSDVTKLDSGEWVQRLTPAEQDAARERARWN